MKKGKILTIIILVILSASLVRIGVSAFSIWNDSNNVIVDDDTSEWDVYIEDLKKQSSEIDGMTKYDKYIMGLGAEAVDSDCDGLTDKEELEIYFSDPLLVSSSGDLYSDGYKVQHGMDLNKKYDYENDLQFKWNECNEVMLIPQDAADYRAIVDEKQSKEDGIYKEYFITQYSGTIKIDINEVLESNDLSENELEVWSFELMSGSFQKEKYKIDDGIIVLKNTFDYNSYHYVFVINTDKIASLNKVDSLPAVGGMSKESTSGNGLICGSPLLTLFGHQMTIYYVDLGDDELNSKEIEILMNSLKYIYDTDYEKMKDNIIVREYGEIEALFKMLCYILPDFKLDKISDFNWINFIYTYAKYDTLYDESLSDQNSKTVMFNVTTDALPFKNFGSYISPGGNCAGIAWYTALLFNNSKIEPSGSYKMDIDEGLAEYGGVESGGMQTIYWKIENEGENATLLNRGLSDYKDSGFVKKHSKSVSYKVQKDNKETSTNANIMSDLSGDEIQFINMIGCLWKEYNDKTLDSDTVNAKSKGDTDYSMAIIEEVKDKLNSGEVLILTLRQRRDTKWYTRLFTGKREEVISHAVNVYDYREYDNGIIVLYIYENNYPGIAKTLLIVPDKSNQNKTFDYTYKMNDDYIWTSVNAWGFVLSFYDDQLNLITEH